MRRFRGGRKIRLCYARFYWPPITTVTTLESWSCCAVCSARGRAEDPISFAGSSLFPAYGQLPAHLTLGGFAQHAFELFHLAQDRWGFCSQRGGRCFEVVEQGANGNQAIFGREPLRWRQGLGPLRIARAFF